MIYVLLEANDDEDSSGASYPKGSAGGFPVTNRSFGPGCSVKAVLELYQ